MNAGASTPESAAPSTAAAAPGRKPRFALLCATACGLGNIPVAPGTFGSLGGILLALLPWWLVVASVAIYSARNEGDGSLFFSTTSASRDPFLIAQIVLAILIGAFGVWSANRAGKFWAQKDPQRVVVDEVSGQHLALLVGCGVPIWWRASATVFRTSPIGLISLRAALNWQYLLLGLILFRVFDIWKPFPARQAESLPGGWGIMADDWVAAIYAAIGLWIARGFGL